MMKRCFITTAVSLFLLTAAAGAETHTWNSNKPPVVTDGDVVVIKGGAMDGTNGLKVPAGATITIDSEGQVDNRGRNVTLIIPEGSKVIWKAKYGHSVRGIALESGAYGAAGGEFEVVDGASIEVVNAEGCGGAICDRSKSMVVTVSGGLVDLENSDGVAISAKTVVVSGGMVRHLRANKNSSGAIEANTVVVSGGKVRASGGAGGLGMDGASAISTYTDQTDGNVGTVKISGGQVGAEEGYAVELGSGCELTVSGGFVFARSWYGGIVKNYGVIRYIENKVTFDGPVGNGIVVSHDGQESDWVGMDFIAGAKGGNDYLTIMPAGANVTWDKIGGQEYAGVIYFGKDIIRYANGANSGIYYLSASDDEASVSVLSSDRLIPGVKSGESAVAPVIALTAEFTAGPNPVGKLGIVNFYRQGSSAGSARLTIYDVSGNVVRSIAISDKAIGGSGRRLVGSWDLTDFRGRPVGEGSYLVKGTIAVNGKRETVSLVVGVR